MSPAGASFGTAADAAAAETDDQHAPLPPLAGGAIVVGLGLVALELAVAGRYGYHRDELYFLACARHLAWGYVDQPPLVPAVARLSTALFGSSLMGLRLLPALAGGAVVVLAALMARELGGKREAQLIAALATATSAEIVAVSHLLSTATFDLFFWALLTWAVLRLLRTADPRWWLAVGVLAGIGLLNKDNVVFLLVALLVGLPVGGRGRSLASRWLVGGAVAALVIVTPDLLWNAHHGWAAIEMAHQLHTEISGWAATLELVPLQVVVVGIVLLPLWIGGLRYLWRRPGVRPVAVAYVVVLVLYALGGGKPYYPAGIYPVLFAAGGAWAEQRLAAGDGPHLSARAVTMIVGVVLSLPLLLPVLPQSALATGAWQGAIDKELSATVGWPQLVAQVARVADQLPATERRRLVVFAGDYGAAGAIDLYGGRHGLPPAISGQNTYWWWGPSGASDGATTIAVNLSAPYLRTIFSQVVEVARVATPHGVWTEERGARIYLCRGQRVSWARLWPGARRYG